jgi:hypothetical protein
MFEIEQQIYFKREGGKRLLKGTIIGRGGDGWQVRGTRTATKSTPPVFTLQAHEITTNHIPPSQRVRKLETGHGSGLSIMAVESIRRREISAARLGMTETQVLQAAAMLEMRRRALRNLAATNGISFSRYDFEFGELESEYIVGTLSALRSTVSRAPDADLDEFRAYLSGEVADSRVMMTISRTSRTAAVRYLKRRTEYHRHHVDIHDVEYRLAA